MIFFGLSGVQSKYYIRCSGEMDQLSNAFSLLELDAADDDREQTTVVAAEGEF